MSSISHNSRYAHAASAIPVLGPSQCFNQSLSSIYEKFAPIKPTKFDEIRRYGNFCCFTPLRSVNSRHEWGGLNEMWRLLQSPAADECMTFSIMHISDLHRSPHDPISNDELISALVGDRDRYTREDPSVRPPDAIVVSGEVVQGFPLYAKRNSALVKSAPNR